MPDIRIVPGNAIMSFTSSLNFIERITQDPSGSLTLYGSGSVGRTDLFSIDGNNGRLFSVSDDLSDSLFSVNTIAGLPVIEAFANNSVNIGQYTAPPIKVTGSNAIITGSLFGTATSATNAVNVAFNLTSNNANYPIAFSLDNNAGNKPIYLDTGLGCYVNPATDTIGATTFVGAFSGNASTATSASFANTSSWATNVINNGVTSVATNNGLTGGTITSTGTIGLTGQALALHNLSTNGIIVRTGSGTVAGRTLTGTSNQITVTNGDGVSGNPTVSLPATITGLTSVTSTTFVGGLTGTATSATSASNVSVLTSATDSEFKIPFTSHTGGTTGIYGLLQDPDTGMFTYNPYVNRLTVSSISGSSYNLSGGHALYNYSGVCVLQASTGTTISLGGGPGNIQNNVNVVNGTLAAGTTSPQGKFHVYQSTNLGGTTGNSLILQTVQNPGGSGGNNVYIKDYALRDATGTTWTTWRHHNSIDIDGSHNTPGTNTKAFYERDPLSGLHEFGQEATYAVTIDGVNSRIGVATRTPSYPLHVNTSVSSISIYASADIVAYSDESVKGNIRPIENVIERIEQSRGVLYDRTDIKSKDNIGFIAQELEVAFPELVVTNEDGTKAVKYQNTVAVLFEAIKEQQKQIDELKQIVNGITR